MLAKLFTAQHFLLDYDGLLVNSEALYFETWCSLLSQEGQTICQNFHKGRHESEVYVRVSPFLVKEMSLPQVSEHRKRLFEQLVQAGDLQLMPGIEQLLFILSRIAPLSIVSNSERQVVDDGLKATGIGNYFTEKYCYSEAIKRKPAPDLYAAALSRLTLSGDSVIAFEDSETGLLAALAAGVPVICINKDVSLWGFCRSRGIYIYPTATELAEIMSRYYS